MRRFHGSLVPAMLLLAAAPAALAQAPAEPAEVAPAEAQPAEAKPTETARAESPASAETVEEEALAAGITPEMVQKLDPGQLYELLRKRDRDQMKLEAIRAGYSGDSEDIIIPLSFFLTGIAIVFVIFFFRARYNRERLETIRLMVEKGVEIRPELLTGNGEQKKEKGPLASAMSSLFLGIGVILFFLVFQVGPPGLWGVGFIPLFIGLGKLVAWRVESRNGSSDHA